VKAALRAAGEAFAGEDILDVAGDCFRPPEPAMPHDVATVAERIALQVIAVRLRVVLRVRINHASGLTAGATFYWG